MCTTMDIPTYVCQLLMNETCNTVLYREHVLLEGTTCKLYSDTKLLESDIYHFQVNNKLHAVPKYKPTICNILFSLNRLYGDSAKSLLRDF